MNRLLPASVLLLIHVLGPIAIARAQTTTVPAPPPPRSPDRLRHTQFDLEMPMRFGPGGPLVGISGYVGYADGALDDGAGSFWGAGLRLGYESVMDDARCVPIDRTHCREAGRLSGGPQLRLGWAWGQGGGDQGPDAYVYLFATGFAASTSDRGGSVGTRLGLAYTWDGAFATLTPDRPSQDQGMGMFIAMIEAALVGHMEAGWEHEAIAGQGEDRGYFALGVGY